MTKYMLAIVTSPFPAFSDSQALAEIDNWLLNFSIRPPAGAGITTLGVIHHYCSIPCGIWYDLRVEKFLRN